MTRLAVRLLGPLQITLDDEPVSGFESNKVRALLVYLAVEAARPHSRAALAGLLWPDQPDRAAHRNLSQALFNIRQALRDDEASPPLLRITRAAVQLEPEGDHWVDGTALTAHLAASEAHAHPALERCEPCMARLEQAVELYSGEFLAGFFVDDSVPFAEWAALLRERYHRQVLDALYRLAAYHERRRDYGRAQHYARRQVELEPWREEAHRQLMQVLARSGQRSAALRQYEISRRALHDELGIAPQQETTALYERIRMTGSTRPHNLPEPLTPFVGRQEQLAQIAAYLEDPACRLLTLAGPGGIGKTRLALQAAREGLDLFCNGVWFVPLASAATVESLVSAAVDALGIQLDGKRRPEEQLLDSLRPRELLLVLDSLEHLGQGVEWLAELLRRAPRVRILATSRERLQLRAEWVLDVPGLDYPPDEGAASIADYGAVRLFLQSAARVRAGFALTDEDRPHVAQVCRLLEGVPLALELASAWVRTLSCERIAQEIQDNLDCLASSLRDMPPRHRSMRAVFQYSWDLLTADDQEAAARLSIFCAPFRPEAAQAVAGVGPAALQALADKSFLGRQPAGRYAFHALMRQYTAEQLARSPDAEEAMQAAHGRYYAGWLQQRESDLRGARQVEAQAEIRAELEDVAAVWTWACTHQEWETIARGLEGLYLFYRGYGHFQEGQERLASAAAAVAALEEAPPLLLAQVRARQADLRSRLGDYGAARALLQQSMAVFEAQQVERERAFALAALGRMAYWSGDYDQARPLLQSSVALYRQTGDAWGTAQVLNDWANVISMFQDGFTEARQLYEESLALSRQAGDQDGIARALINLGTVDHGLRDYDAARHFYQEALAICRATGNRQLMAIALGNLGNLAVRLGKQDQALELLQESLDIKRETGNRFSMLYALHHLGKATSDMGRYDDARLWYRQALQLAADIGATAFMAYVLADMADLLALTGEAPRAMELLQVALDHAGDDQEVIATVDRVSTALTACLDPQTAAACRERSRGRRLADVVSQVLAT